MARRKREPMSEGKKNIIRMLLEEYDIKSAKDIYGFEVSNGTTFERDGFKASIIFPPLLVRSVLRRA